MNERCSSLRVGHIGLLVMFGRITIGRGDVILRQKVEELLRAGVQQILIDLSHVPYMDAAGLGELIACSNRTQAVDGVIKLLNPSGRVYDLFFLTKLADVFEIYRDEKEALVSFPKPQSAA